MTQASNYLENEILDHVLSVGAYTMPANIYLALYTSSPTDADSGTEVSGSGYAREEITFGSASGGSASNTNEMTFAASGGNFGTISHIGIRDASSGGNLLVWGALDTSRTVNDGESIIFSIGDITVSMD